MGERLGRYTVLKHLASGGMADVLIGRTDGIEGFERHVVLKRIRAENARDQRFIQMFLDEARVAAGLHHQNIVQVFDIGESSGEYFFAMEYIHGEDLRKLLSAVSKTRTHMPLGYVCAILSAAAAGLHYAHERRAPDKRPLNIVHRDVSPSNILIGYDGAVKLVDFGIAKASTRTVETRSGSLKGKVSYMSPEQCKGEEIDRRSDVYALGVLLYELATTTRLFKGDNDYLMMDAIVQGKVPLPRVRRPDLPNDLSSIIMRALEKDRTRRYQTADELRIALDQFAVKHGLTASTSAIATYMNKMFGERIEPWLDEGTEATGDAIVDAEGPTQSAHAAHRSWTEVPRDEFDDNAPPREEAKTTTDRKHRRSGVSAAVSMADTIVPPITPKETGTSMKMGWEKKGYELRANKWVWIAGAAVLVVGVGIWQLATRSDEPTQVVAAQELAPPPAPVTEPEPSVESVIPTVRVAGPEPIAAAPAPAEPPPIVDPPPAKKAAPVAPAKRKAKEAEKTKPAGSAAAPVPTPLPAVAPAPPPPPPEPPKEIEVYIPSLSNATVSAVASDHARQLADCEGGAELHGEVSVSFQIDANGRVVKSQLSSSVRSPKVAGCILKAVQSWKFPKPPSGSAKGVYSISYQ